MKPIERILHSLIFEVIALILMSTLAVLVTGKAPLAMTGMALSLSLIAMVWNYIYNIIFDRIFGSNRIERKLWVRILHGGCFECGMVVLTFPVIMWVMKKDFWTVLALDLGAMVFFLIYAIIYNWIYDHVRNYFQVKKKGVFSRAA